LLDDWNLLLRKIRGSRVSLRHQLPFLNRLRCERVGLVRNVEFAGGGHPCRT